MRVQYDEKRRNILWWFITYTVDGNVFVGFCGLTTLLQLTLTARLPHDTMVSDKQIAVRQMKAHVL